MTLRERLMTVLRGGRADCVPFTIYEWLLPNTPAAKRLHKQGLILIGSRSLYREIQRDVSIESKEVEESGQKKMITRIKTPVGEVIEKAGFDPHFNSRWIQEHFIKSIEDYKVIQFVFEHTSYEPSYATYCKANQKIGEAGIISGEILPIPIQRLLVHVMGPQTWSEGIMLYEEQFNKLHEALYRNYCRQAEIAAQSPAEVIWFPDNVTGSMMSPAMFNKYCKPIYDYACFVIKQASKLSFAHYDGANKTLKDCIASTDLDIIEAFTPPPMGDMKVREARAAWPGKVVSLNFPGNLFDKDTKVIERYACAYMEEGGDRGRFVMGCTEEFDPNYFEHTFSTIAQVMDKFNKTKKYLGGLKNS